MSSDPCTTTPAGVVLTNVPYTSEADDPARQLDLYIAAPSEPSATRLPTLLVYVHGGLWMDRDKCDYQHIGRHWASRGVTTAFVNYRQTQHRAKDAAEGEKEDLSLVIRHPTHTLDLAAALVFLTTDACSPHIPAAAYDRRRVVVFGHSCGAHMLALLVSDPAYQLPPATLSALVGCAGCEGLYAVARYAAAHPDWSADLYRVFARFDDPIDRPHLLPGAERVPWLVLHSGGDVWVERQQAELWEQWMGSRGGKAQVVDITGGHWEVIERIGSDEDAVSSHLLPWIEQLPLLV